MIPTVRLYQSSESAQEAAARLADAGFDQQTIILADAPDGAQVGAQITDDAQATAEGQVGDGAAPAVDEGAGEAALLATIQSATEAGHLPGGYKNFCIQNLGMGRSIVAVRVHFGRGQEAIEIMESCGAIDSGHLPQPISRDPSPFSDFLGIPTLSKSEPMTLLTDSDWTLSWMFNLKLLSKKPAPLSSMFGMRLLSSSKQSWKSSFGMPLLSDKAAPLSSMFGLKTLTTEKRSWTRSFGMPLLSKNPAPLSTLLGMPTLTKD